MRVQLIAVAVWSVLLAGACTRLGDDCRNTETCPHPDAGVGGNGGGGGGLPAGCVPSDNDDPVSNDCGVFVSSSVGDDGAADGTKEKPYATIGEALANLGGSKAVYLCGETYEEGVVVSAGVNLYGGLKCQNGWMYGADARASIEAEAGGIGLTISGSGTSDVQDVNVSAEAAIAAGGSSIAVAVEDATVNFSRCDVAAGNAADGADGEAAAAAEAKAADGNGGGDACSNPGAVLGGLAKPNEACMTSVGGSGGLGNSAGNGGNGDKGQPNDAEMGLGEGQTGAPLACTAGANGLPGTPGMPGAAGSTLGTIAIAGYTGADGLPGDAGAVAQGGGGGGGSKGGLICDMGTTNGAGASGGSGGPGGCGGLGGNPGAAGGSSIALMSINADVTLSECDVTTGKGGRGGAGALGQNGQPGGDGGNGGATSGFGGSLSGCDGGKGGQGGLGGPGGGGRGGHSLGIAYIGGLPALAAGSAIVTGDFGAGGPSSGNPGSAGVKADSQSFE